MVFEIPTHGPRVSSVRHPHGRQGNEAAVRRTTTKSPRKRNDGEAGPGQMPTHMHPSPAQVLYRAATKLCFTTFTNVAYVRLRVRVLHLAFEMRLFSYNSCCLWHRHTMI